MSRLFFLVLAAWWAGVAGAQALPTVGTLATPAPAPQAAAPIVVTPWTGSWVAPSSEYVTAGQDEAGYHRWLDAMPTRAAQIVHFDRYLQDAGVAGVVPTWQLLRTASAWKTCAAEPFEVPPLAEWPNLINTLRYVRAHVIPKVGPVEAVSAYRNPLLNSCAGGAQESAHRHALAVDLVPVQPITRAGLIRRLCGEHRFSGPTFAVGLGFYKGLRFHIDTWRYRKWGFNAEGNVEQCDGPPPIIAAAPATLVPAAQGSQAPTATVAPIVSSGAVGQVLPATTGALPTVEVAPVPTGPAIYYAPGTAPGAARAAGAADPLAPQP